MPIQFVGSNLVVVAQVFNPSVFSQLWLTRNGIVPEGELGPGFLYSEALVQLATEQFLLLVLPNQLQFTPNESIEDQQSLIVDKVGKIIQALPHTPYIAAGLNFVWHLVSDTMSVEELSRSLFYNPSSRNDFYHEFDDKDARFGAYFSRDLAGCRMKLDVKPVTVMDQSMAPQSEALQFAFNFHLDLARSEKRAVEIQGMLERWDEVKVEASRLIELASRGT